jgi:hypothetical protein
MRSFIHGLQSEWLKLKGSLVGWLILGAAFFVPTIILAARMRRPDLLPALYRAAGFWEKLWTQTWESNAIMILPMTMILVTSLVVQIEYRNNTWKLLHATPQRLIAIYAAKLFVILGVMVQFLALLTVAIIATAALPAIAFRDVSFPSSPLPAALFLDRSIRFFIDTLPVVGLQYLLALRFKNFITPLGVGMAAWILSVGMVSSNYSYVVPYCYAGLDYLIESNYKHFANLPASIERMAFAYFALFTGSGYVLYATRADKG